MTASNINKLEDLILILMLIFLYFVKSLVKKKNLVKYQSD